jgi:hypothetical protein
LILHDNDLEPIPVVNEALLRSFVSANRKATQLINLELAFPQPSS